jgi:hypothetical protein
MPLETTPPPHPCWPSPAIEAFLRGAPQIPRLTNRVHADSTIDWDGVVAEQAGATGNAS